MPSTLWRLEGNPSFTVDRCSNGRLPDRAIDVALLVAVENGVTSTSNFAGNCLPDYGKSDPRARIFVRRLVGAQAAASTHFPRLQYHHAVFDEDIPPPAVLAAFA